MNFVAEIDVMPLKELLDPQGKAVAAGLKNLKLDAVNDVRVGKHITLKLEAADKAAATAQVELACKKLLTNSVIEYFTFEVVEA
ncbi:phosphoribosylformylglycinamidine synthase subunit PurS [soil metagenome]